jgi:hypothetical protein
VTRSLNVRASCHPLGSCRTLSGLWVLHRQGAPAPWGRSYARLGETYRCAGLEPSFSHIVGGGLTQQWQLSGGMQPRAVAHGRGSRPDWPRVSMFLSDVMFWILMERWESLCTAPGDGGGKRVSCRAYFEREHAAFCRSLQHCTRDTCEIVFCLFCLPFHSLCLQSLFPLVRRASGLLQTLTKLKYRPTTSQSAEWPSPSPLMPHSTWRRIPGEYCPADSILKLDRPSNSLGSPRTALPVGLRPSWYWPVG